MISKQLSDKEIGKILLHDQLVRREITRKDIYWFFRVYFPHYITYRMAYFQIEILRLLQDDSIRKVAITAFRNSGKSTFCSLLAPVWYIVGAQQKKYILIACQNQDRAKQVLSNIKKELEAGGLLTADFGPFFNTNSEWAANTIVLPRYDARITVLSIGEGMRGVRHGQYRPDVIIVDDVEDVQSAKQKESRDRLWQFINGELIPAGITDVKTVFIGNLVHEDSLMMKLKRTIKDKPESGVFKNYPIYEENKKILWPGKFPDMESVNRLKNGIPSENDFLREYLLIIVPQEDRIIYPEDIHYYDPEKSLDFKAPHFKFFAISIDPAVSERDSADKTGITVHKIYGEGKSLQIYIQPQPVNRRLTVPLLVEEVKKIINSFGSNPVFRVLIEGGSTQKGIYQVLVNEGIPAEEITPQGQDKNTRLSMAKNWIAKGIFKFPKTGAEELISQLLYFGTERYDDLVDSLTLFFHKMLNMEIQPKNTAFFIPCSDIRSSSLDASLYDKDWADWEDEEIFEELGLRYPQRILS